MRKSIPFLIIVTVVSLFVCSAYGQHELLQQSIYFESAKYDLTAESKTTLDKLLDSLKNFQTYQIFIKGNTDNVGNSTYNQHLSVQRVNSTENYFINHGIPTTVFTTAAFGEEKPIADNQLDEGKQKNRRVDISIAFMRKVPIDSAQFKPSIFELYKLSEIEPQEFCIDPTKDTLLRCNKGTIVYVKANSFKIPNACKVRCLTIKVKEDYLKSEMILDNLSTTSNGQILETQGMVYTEANDCRGNKVNLAKGKDIVVVVPIDKVVPDAKIFQGDRTPHDSIMNWTVSNTSVLSNFSLKELNYCLDWLGCGGVRFSCDRCKFFFCRISRIGVAYKGITDMPTHLENAKFRNCQRQLRKERRAARRYSNTPLPQTTILNQRPEIALELIPKCEQLEELFEKYGVNDLTALVTAINKPLMDSLGVTSLKELQDTLPKLNAQRIELSYLNKQVSFDDFKFYVYNTSRLGWSNIDLFANIPNDSLVTMKINLPIQQNVDCKLVFIDRQYVIPPDKTSGQYEFEGLPKGEKVWIVALLYDEGKPYLSMEQTTIDNKTYNVTFKALTLDQLKIELSKLNN